MTAVLAECWMLNFPPVSCVAKDHQPVTGPQGTVQAGKILERLYLSNMPFEKASKTISRNSRVLSTWSNTIFRIAFYLTSMRIICKLVCWWWFQHLFKKMFAKFDIFHFLRGTENIEHSKHVQETASSLIEPFCFHQLIRRKDHSMKS